MLDAAADAHMERNPGTCLDTSGDFDVLLWEVPAATIRSPDAALFDSAPNDVWPLPAFHLKVVVEVDHVLSIDIHVLDHALGQYRLFRSLTPEQEVSTVEVPIRIQIDWTRLARLVR
jgi:hypothetical protein